MIGLQRFSWLPEDTKRTPGNAFACRVKSLAAGLGTIVELVEANAQADNFEESPALDQNQVGDLVRLAAEVAYVLENAADDYLKWAEKYEKP